MKIYIKFLERKMNKKRIYAGIIDFILASIIQAILMMTLIIRLLIEASNERNLFKTFIAQLIMIVCSISYLIFRDIIGKKSIGKRIMKIKIINTTNNEDAKFSKKF